MLTWPLAFALTLAIETPLYAWALRSRLGVGRACLVSLLLNLATHPACWFTIRGLRPWAYVFVGAELLVWLVEAALLRLLAGRLGAPMAAKEALAISFLANSVSAAVGLLLF